MNVKNILMIILLVAVLLGIPCNAFGQESNNLNSELVIKHSDSPLFHGTIMAYGGGGGTGIIGIGIIIIGFIIWVAYKIYTYIKRKLEENRKKRKLEEYRKKRKLEENRK